MYIEKEKSKLGNSTPQKPKESWWSLGKNERYD
jgi:hypothetical protein